MATLVKVNHFSALFFTIDWKLPLVTLFKSKRGLCGIQLVPEAARESIYPDTKIIFMSVLVSLLLMSH